MPDDVQLNVIFDQSSYVRKAIAGLTRAGIGGMLLVVIILILFLGNFRSALIVSISLPLSALFAFLVLSITGQTINGITLGGIVLVLGLLVDNSIVVLENIDRHLRMNKSAWQAAQDAALEVATPVLASTLVIIVVFFPVIFMTGMAKFLFSPLAITVAGAMAGSYIFALTLVPLTAAYLFRNKLPDTDNKPKKSALGFVQLFIDRLRNRYESSLITALKYKWYVLSATACVFLFSLFVMKYQLGYELFPTILFISGM